MGRPNFFEILRAAAPRKFLKKKLETLPQGNSRRGTLYTSKWANAGPRAGHGLWPMMRREAVTGATRAL
eukprot:2176350-Prymnesium_polylepis.1